MQDIIDNNALVRDSASFRISTKFATAPINLAVSVRNRWSLHFSKDCALMHFVARMSKDQQGSYWPQGKAADNRECRFSQASLGSPGTLLGRV